MAESKRITLMWDLWRQMSRCYKCEIAKYARTKVFGDGNVSSPLVFVGEAPGMDEDACGHPFVGRAGGIYDNGLKAAGIVRPEVFTMNVLKCHPAKITEPEPAGNREPTSVEIENCFPFFVRQLGIIQPKVIVAMGRTAIKALVDTTESVTAMVRDSRVFEPHDLRVKEPIRAIGARVGVTFHPQYLGYRSQEKGGDLWTLFVRNLRTLKEISEQTT